MEVAAKDFESGQTAGLNAIITEGHGGKRQVSRLYSNNKCQWPECLLEAAMEKRLRAGKRQP